MSAVSNEQIETWEDDGGAGVTALRGTENQVEWALRIKCLVNEEFDRVSAAFRVVADRQTGGQRLETETIIAIVEEKRSEVMGREEAGYFIRGWQEIGDQVRQLVFQDARYQAIKANWPSRRSRHSEIGG